MKFKRTVLIPLILTFSAAGSILASSAVPAMAAQAPAAHTHVLAAVPNYYYNG